jgi:hypothetical protein
MLIPPMEMLRNLIGTNNEQTQRIIAKSLRQTACRATYKWRFSSLARLVATYKLYEVTAY